MKIVADLHLHSKYSRAVSREMELPTMARWAQKKGIDLLAIPDWTHPLWLKEAESVLTEASPGIYSIANSPTRFVFSTEIASIYTQGGKGRRIHNVVLAPSLETVHLINDELKRRGMNLLSDGRPIVSLSSIQLAELVFGIDDQCLIVPAHIWTPWFSMFGSKSGFNSVAECWDKYSDRIYAIETGLSSDPAMNWRVGDLDQRSILSSSDAHSPAKMGREATVLTVKSNKLKVISEKQKKEIFDHFSYHDLAGAIKQDAGCDWEIGYTIEFYPEEGKYHWTGHRNCQVSFSPQDTKNKGTICPVCGRPLTVGVENRVQDLATREIIKETKVNPAGVTGYYGKKLSRPPYIMLVPLQEIIAEAIGVANTYSPKVQTLYDKLVTVVAPEFDLLTKTEIGKITQTAGEKVAEGIAKVRAGQIVVKPGFDGQFGIVKIWGDHITVQNAAGNISSGQSAPEKQMSLF